MMVEGGGHAMTKKAPQSRRVIQRMGADVVARRGFVILTLEFRREGGYWLGRCRELGTSTFARTLSQVRRELVELVELHLNGLDEAGERERFFHEHHIRLYMDELPAEVETCVPIAVDDASFIQMQPVPLMLPEPRSSPVTAQGLDG
jgi:predicted RNase H-like HicB family nuclease